MAQVQIFTQAELNDLNLKLDQLAKNLDVHVNGSLSKAHGLNLTQINFKDSGGDTVGNYALTFQFGTPPNNFTLYVPARILTSGDPGPHSTSNGGAGNTNGSNAVSGVPILPKAVITESPSADALAQVEVYNELLLTHSNSTLNDTTVNQDHGGTSYQLETILDSLGHTIGKYTVTIGVNGRAIKLPADTLIPGPPGPGPVQLPRGGLLYTYKKGALIPPPNQYNWADSRHTDSQYIDIVLQLPTYYLPFTAIYQINGATSYNITSAQRHLTAVFPLATDWLDLTTGAGGESGNTPHGYGYSPTHYAVGNDNLTMRMTQTSAVEGGSFFIQAVRVKFTATDRTWYSNTVLFTGDDDESGGQFFYNVPTDYLPGPIV